MNLDSVRPAFFLQERVGLNKSRLRMYKFRTQYIDEWSLWRDMKILAMTIPAVVKGAGAKWGWATVFRSNSC